MKEFCIHIPKKNEVIAEADLITTLMRVTLNNNDVAEKICNLNPGDSYEDNNYKVTRTDGWLKVGDVFYSSDTIHMQVTHIINDSLCVATADDVGNYSMNVYHRNGTCMTTQATGNKE